MDREEKDRRYRAVYQRNEDQNRCGYWSVCDDHACGCSPTAKVSQGYDFETYQAMSKAYYSGDY